MKSSHAKTIQRLFTGAYVLLIISTIAHIKSIPLLADAVFMLRVCAFSSILIAWLINASHRLRTERISIYFLIIFAPYAFTDARMAYLDVLIILVTASSIKDDPENAKFFLNLATISLAVALTIALLAWMSILPQVAFEWKDRVKYSMGFSNPNTFFYYIFSSAFVFFVFRRTAAFLLCGFLIFALYTLVGSRTFLIAYALLLAAWIKPSFFQKQPIIIGLWLWLTLVVTLGFAIAVLPLPISIALSSLIGIDVNELTSSRFDVINDTANRTPIELIFGGKQNYGDSLYVYLLNDFGLIWMPVFFYFIIKSIRHLTKDKEPSTLVLACIYFTIGLAEVPFDGSSLVALLFVMSTLYHRRLTKHSSQATNPPKLEKQCAY